MSLDLNRISAGPGALNSEAQNEILEMLQLLKQWELQIMQEGVKVQSASAQAEGDAAHDAQVRMALSTQASAIGETIGSGVGGTVEGVGIFGGGHGATIEENNKILTNVDEADKILRSANGQGAMLNREASPADRDAAMQDVAKNKNISLEANEQRTTLVNKLKNGKGQDFRQPLTKDEKALLSTFTKDERETALSNLSEVRKEAHAKIREAGEQRQHRQNQARMFGTVITGVTKGSSQGAASAYQMQQADFEKNKVVFQFVTTAQNNLQQQFSTLFDSYEQKQNKIIEADDAHFRRFGG